MFTDKNKISKITMCGQLHPTAINQSWPVAPKWPQVKFFNQLQITITTIFKSRKIIDFHGSILFAQFLNKIDFFFPRHDKNDENCFVMTGIKQKLFLLRSDCAPKRCAWGPNPQLSWYLCITTQFVACALEL